MSTLTHAAQVVESVEYIEEVAYDTFPTNPAMVYLANTALAKISKNPNVQAKRRLGSEDPHKFASGKQENTLSLEGTLPDAAGSLNFIRYGINALNAAATNAKSLAIAYSYKLDGTKNFRKSTGCRIQTLRLTGSPDTPEIKWSADLIPATIAAPTTTDFIGTGAHGTADTNAIIDFASGGADPIVFNSVAVPTTSINLTWTRNLSNKHIMGKKGIKYQYPTQRSQIGDISVAYLTKTLEDALDAGTTASLVWTYRTGQTVTLANCRFLQLGDETFDADSTEGLDLQFGLEALSSTIA